jgi:hypothetical protein
MNRREKAMRIGGVFLVRVMLRQFPQERYSFRHRLTREEVERYKLVEQTRNSFLEETVSSLLTKDPSEMGSEELSLLREEFYRSVNMNGAHIRRWIADPRIVDGVGPFRKEAQARIVRQRLRQLVSLLFTANRDGSGWTLKHYKVAQDAAFVVNNIFHPWKVDYETWVVLRNFGRDWARPTRLQPSRKLPPLVELEAELSKLRFEKTGKDDFSFQH